MTVARRYAPTVGSGGQSKLKTANATQNPVKSVPHSETTVKEGREFCVHRGGFSERKRGFVPGKWRIVPRTVAQDAHSPPQSGFNRVAAERTAGGSYPIWASRKRIYPTVTGTKIQANRRRTGSQTDANGSVPKNCPSTVLR